MNFANSSKFRSTLYIQLKLSVVFLLISFTCLYAQPNVEWSTVLGGTLNDIPNAIQLTSDNGYIIAGQSNSSNGNVSGNKGGFDLWVTRLDGLGNIIWENNYGGSADDYALDIQKTSDGGYILVGGTASNDLDINVNKGVVDVWILKINVDGNLEWSKTYGGVGVDFGTSLQVLNDGYVIAGCTGSGGNGDVSPVYGSNDYWVLKVDLNGNLLWEKTYGGSRHDAAKKVIQTNDGGFLVAGNTWSDDGDVSNAQGVSDVWIIKIDASGLLQWDKIFGTDIPEIFNDMTATTDGNYVFVGNKSELDLVINGFFGRYDEQAWMVKIDPNGQELFSKTYGGEGYDRANSIEATMDGGYIIGSNVRSKTDDFVNNAGHDDIYLIKTNAQGNSEWTKLIGGAENEVVKAVRQSNDGGYLMLGYSSSTFVDTTFVKIGFEDWWALKFAGNAISVSLGGDQTICENESVTLNATVAGCNCSYLWSDGNTNAIRDLSPSATTMYAVTVTNSDGIEGSDLVTIYVSTPQFDLDVTHINCAEFENGSAVLTPQGNGYSFEWSNGNTTSMLTGVGAGTYTYTVTDGNNCSTTDQVTLNQPQPILINENIINVDCFGNNNASIDLSIDGGTGDYDYLWAGGQTSQDINNLTAGSYTITITDDNGCIKIQDWTVNEPPSINISSNPFPTLCFDSEDGGTMISVDGGTGSYAYAWSNNSNNKDLENVSSGTYTLTVTDGNLCQKTMIVEITAPTEIVIESTTQAASCFGNNDGFITTEVSGGAGDYQYQWADGPTTANRLALSSGTYTVTVIDGNLCEVVKEIVVSQNTNIDIVAQITGITCHNDTNGIIDLTASGGSGDLNFIWNNGNDSEDIGNLTAGDYIVTITDANGCEAVELFTIPAVDSITITSTVFSANCYGENSGLIQTEAFGGNGSFNYFWSSGEVVATIENLFAGQYVLVVSDLNGCTANQTFEIEEPDPILLSPILVNPISCFGASDGAIDIAVEGGTGDTYTVDWSSGANSNLSAGTYSVTVTDMNNCMVSSELMLSEPDSFYIDFQMSNPVNGDDGSIISQVNGGTPPYDFNWNDSTWTDGDIFNLPGGTYDLILTDANGCTIEESVLLDPLSIFEIGTLEAFDIFPNPSNGTFFIKLEFEKIEKIEIIITDELGRTIERFLRNDDAVLEKNTLQNISAGVYFILVKTESGVAVKKLIVQN